MMTGGVVDDQLPAVKHGGVMGDQLTCDMDGGGGGDGRGCGGTAHLTPDLGSVVSCHHPHLRPRPRHLPLSFNLRHQLLLILVHPTHDPRNVVFIIK